MLMRLPARMGMEAAGRVVENPVELRDVLPTLLEAAGAETPASVEGRSLLGLVRNGGAGWREFIELEHDICYGPENHWNGLTDGKWKYLYHAQHGEEQLFHLKTDPQELTDLAGDGGACGRAADVAWAVGGAPGRTGTGVGEEWAAGSAGRGRRMLLSPNFPGYADAETIAKRVAGGA